MPNKEFFRTYYKRTVCEVTREIFDILNENHKKIGDSLYSAIFNLLQEQMTMQKKMDARLKYYKDTYEQDYEDNTDTDNKIRKRTPLYEELINESMR